MCSLLDYITFSHHQLSDAIMLIHNGNITFNNHMNYCTMFGRVNNKNSVHFSVFLNFYFFVG